MQGDGDRGGLDHVLMFAGDLTPGFRMIRVRPVQKTFAIDFRPIHRFIAGFQLPILAAAEPETDQQEGPREAFHSVGQKPVNTGPCTFEAHQRPAGTETAKSAFQYPAGYTLPVPIVPSGKRGHPFFACSLPPPY
ncbi:hypothetical protein ES703_32972 [subsurface metagenome]